VLGGGLNECVYSVYFNRALSLKEDRKITRPLMKTSSIHSSLRQ
jgi:hypothetical protein